MEANYIKFAYFEKGDKFNIAFIPEKRSEIKSTTDRNIKSTIRKTMNITFHYTSPLGGITLSSDGESLTGLWFDGQKYYPNKLVEESTESELPIFAQTCNWLDIYFSGEEPDFTPSISLQTTTFRKAVYDILLTIPYGQTMTYGEIANILAEQQGVERMSAQAVGSAVGHNPISIIIPCHRVVGADGSLTGYAGGLDKKTALLKLEKYEI